MSQKGKYAVVEDPKKNAFEIVKFDDIREGFCEVVAKSIDYNGFGDSAGNPIFDRMNYEKAKRAAEALVFQANRKIRK